jgi:hypothetical protein
MFYTVTSQDVSTLTGYVAGIVGDFMPIILLILGVTIGLYVFNKIAK